NACFAYGAAKRRKPFITQPELLHIRMKFDSLNSEPRILAHKLGSIFRVRVNGKERYDSFVRAPEDKRIYLIFMLRSVPDRKHHREIDAGFLHGFFKPAIWSVVISFAYVVHTVKRTVRKIIRIIMCMKINDHNAKIIRNRVISQS